MKALRLTRYLGCAIVLTLFTFVFTSNRLTAQTQLVIIPIPSEFSGHYSFLDSQLSVAENYVATRWTGEKNATTFSTELLAANGNQGERLLTEQAWQSILFNIERIQFLGVSAVKIKVGYPILVPTFPRSAEYLQLFKRVGQELKKRNLRFLIQMTSTFTEPAFSSVPVAPYYAGLTWERFKQEMIQMAQTIINEIQPDYLTLSNEPGTQQANTGLIFNVSTFTELIQSMLKDLNRGQTLIGAGAGTWEDLAYFQSLAQNATLDYIDIHIYPINQDYLIERVTKIAQLAKNFNKKLFIGETWLYKTLDRELRGAAVAAAPTLFARDVFSFWESLDVRFIKLMVTLAHYLKVDFLSFFWMRYFFGYVEYTERTKNLTPTQLFNLANQEASKNMQLNPPKLTQTGLTFQQVIK
jgi:hypothetical protein